MSGSPDPEKELVDALDVVFGARMRRRREELGRSQQYVANYLQEHFGINWHQTTVGKTETGERPIRLAEALAVCLSLDLGTRLDLLMYAAPEEAEAAVTLRRALVELLGVRSHVDRRVEELQRELTPSTELDSGEA